MSAADLGASLPLWSVLPFAGLLASIALFPLLAPHFWHRHFGKVVALWGAAFAVPFLIVFRGDAARAVVHTYVADYLPFVVLLWGLFTVSGGLVLEGDLRGTPATNTALLGVGALLASWIGTTGAAMVLIRPLLRANAARRSRTHTVVFFIFLVANIGGVLTPLGDPPLFLGFLRGVPFFWTFRLALEMGVALALLLPAYFLLDRRAWRREPPEATAPPAGPRRPLRLRGLVNLPLLAGIVGAVILSALWRPGETTLFGATVGVQELVRDGLIVAIGLLSLALTPRGLRRANGFSWGPIAEVAILFAAIFAAMIAPLAILAAGERGALAGLVRAVDSPAAYFWATGLLSSVLDNAPTYLTFFAGALGRFSPGAPHGDALAALLGAHGHYLEAISAGAVFMGANTYIGNAPNFMVKAIAEEAGVEMPSFGGYVVRYALPFLLPVYVVLTFALSL